MTEDAGNVHYEGELVLVMAREAKDVPAAEAQDFIFGVTAGNDVSERDWQSADLQWFRAKASDTYGPIGPVISRGVNYDDLQLTTRLNGEIVQQQRTSDLIFDTSDIVSYVSRYVTLMPGDVIFTGTPGTTRAMQEGDRVSVEVETVGGPRKPGRPALADRAGLQAASAALRRRRARWSPIAEQGTNIGLSASSIRTAQLPGAGVSTR